MTSSDRHDAAIQQQIEDTRIVYEPRGSGITNEGCPFSVDFPEPVDPVEFCETISTAEAPWNMFGVRLQLAEDYWKLAGVLYHLEDGEVVDASKITLEVAPEWARIYVKEGCSAARATEFVRTLQDEYGVEVNFPDDS